MSLHVKDAGVWKVATPSVKDAGVWKPVVDMFTKITGVWTLVYTAAVASIYNLAGGPSQFYESPVTLTASRNVVWTWSKSGAPAATASPASGTTAASLTLTLPQGTFDREAVFTISANDSGNITNWSITVTVAGTG